MGAPPVSTGDDAGAGDGMDGGAMFCIACTCICGGGARRFRLSWRSTSMASCSTCSR